MKSYPRIPVWETKKRIEDLTVFRMAVERYFLNTSLPRGRPRQRTDNAQAATKAREQINRSMQRVRKVALNTGVSESITYTPPPIIGGPIVNVNIIQNIFNLGQFEIGSESVLGVLDQAAGVYSDDLPSAWQRTLNPFWWLGKLLVWIAHLPFFLLGAAGFDSQKAEQSFIGKLVSLIFTLTTFIASLLVILNLLGFLDQLKTYLLT